MARSDVARLFMHGRSQAVRLPQAYRLPGDRVRCELSPYDLDRARIVYRHR